MKIDSTPKFCFKTRGYGIGGIFNSLIRFFKPVKRQIFSALNKPVTKEILKTVGQEAMSAGSELLLKKIKGSEDLDSLLDKKFVPRKKKLLIAFKKE